MIFSENEILYEELVYTGEDHLGVKGEKGHIFIDGCIPVLICASCGIRHKRSVDGEIKDKSAHVYTSALASLLAEVMGAHAVIKTEHLSSDIEGEELLSDYKKDIKAYIQENNIGFVIDLRGEAKNQKSDIIIGDGKGSFIGNNDIFKKLSSEHFTMNGLSVNMSDQFSGNNSKTTSSFVNKNTDAFAVQMLIKSTCRDPKNNLKQMNVLIESLQDYINLAREQLLAEKYDM